MPQQTGAAEYVRRRYGVPARRHMRVIVDGRPGTITGFRDGYLLVRFDEARPRYPARCHPTWRVIYVTQTPIGDTFWSKVDKSGDCWLWTGYRDRHGYGQVTHDAKVQYVHRLAYENARGAVPEGLVLDHLCRTPACVNPDHLEPVPQSVNVLRGESPIARQARQTHCKRGHEFTPENTLTSGRKRRCATCNREWRQERRAAS